MEMGFKSRVHPPFATRPMTTDEQSALKNARVALPGLGGVGGWHLQVLSQLGIGSFNLADMDHFETVNIQRQAGAHINSLGRAKVEVMAEQALSINPELSLSLFKKGINEENMDRFLDGVDVVVDGLDFFAIDVRRKLYAASRERGIPVVDAGPFGLGTAVLVFLPDGPEFDSYFGIQKEATYAERLLAFALGHGRPGVPMNPENMDFEGRRLPALGPICMLCAAAASTEVLKLLLKHGAVNAAPHGWYCDLGMGKTQPIRPYPKPGQGLSGRLFRWLAFRKYPGLLRMHRQELKERLNGMGKEPAMA